MDAASVTVVRRWRSAVWAAVKASAWGAEAAGPREPRPPQRQRWRAGERERPAQLPLLPNTSDFIAENVRHIHKNRETGIKSPSPMLLHLLIIQPQKKIK